MHVPELWRGQHTRYSLIGEKDKGGVCFPPGLNRPCYNPDTGELVDTNSVKIDISNAIAVRCESSVKAE